MARQSCEILVLAALLLIALLSAADAASDSLEETYTSRGFTKINKKYYYIERNVVADWYEANLLCRKKGAYLASFETKEDFDAMKIYLLLNKFFLSFWISYNDLAKEGTFNSWTTGQPAPYLDWKPGGDPNNVDNNEHCVEFDYVNSMNDNVCAKKNNFVCEIRIPRSVTLTLN